MGGVARWRRALRDACDDVFEEGEGSELIDTVKLIQAFFLDDEEKDRAVALMRRVEAGVKASMSYCINRAVSIS